MFNSIRLLDAFCSIIYFALLVSLCTADLSRRSSAKPVSIVELVSKSLLQRHHGSVWGTEREMTESVVRKRSCNVSICFALDASTGIQGNYNLQKQYVSLVGAVVGAHKNSLLGAVQFGNTTTPISPLTASLTEFISAVKGSDEATDSETNIAAGIGYCAFQLLQTDMKRVTVVLGSGRSTIGFKPEVVADAFVDEDMEGTIIAVSTGNIPNAFSDLFEEGHGILIELRGQEDLQGSVRQTISAICDV